MAVLGGGLGVLGARRSARRSSGVNWAPPRGTLRHGRLAVRTGGDGLPAIVLLHGLFASGRYWGASYDALAAEASLVVPDLAGFGASSQVVGGFGPDVHADLVAQTIRDLGLAGEPAIIGAHSLGSLVAIHLARRHPEVVAGIVAFSPPLYRDQDGARERLSRANILLRLFVSSPSLAAWVCEWMCEHRDLAGWLGRLIRPDLPEPLAEDRLEHTYQSYSETLNKVILTAGASAGIGELAIPVHLVAGGADSIMDHEFLHEIATEHAHVRLSVWPDGQHELPLTHAEACLGQIEQMRQLLGAAGASPTGLSRPTNAPGSASPERPR